MATLSLLDGSLRLTVYYDQSDVSFEDDICFCFVEDSVEDERLFRADEVSIYLTPEQAALLILEINRALESSRLAGTAE